MKWYGTIGYVKSVETRPGIWEEQPTERSYYGDLTSNSRRTQTTDQVNDNITVSNSLSIVADPYANEHFYALKYVVINGAKWKIVDVKVQHPRLILTIGGLYNG